MPGESRTIGGWLALLCAALLVWAPATFVVRASRDLAALPIRGAPLGVMLLIDLCVTACGAAGAVSLMNRHAIGVSLAKWALIGGAAADLVRYTTSIVPNNLMPGDTPYYVAASLAYHAAWLAYLFRSKRVREIMDR